MGICGENLHEEISSKGSLIRRHSEMYKEPVLGLEAEYGPSANGERFWQTVRGLAAESRSGLEFPNLKGRQPLLSVIVPVFNGEKYLLETLASIALQDMQDYEVVVVDGQSTDGTLEILANCSNVILCSERDAGYHEAIGKGISKARGRYIIQCSVSDGFLSPNWFSIVTQRLSEDGAVDLVWGYPRYMSESGYLGAVSYPEIRPEIRLNGFEFFSLWVQTGHWFPEHNMCAKKEVWATCFPGAKANLAIEDPHLMMNLEFHRRGLRSEFIPVIANFGRTHADSVSSSLVANKVLKRQLARYHRLRRRIALREIFSGKVIEKLSGEQNFRGLLKLRIALLGRLLGLAISRHQLGSIG